MADAVALQQIVGDHGSDDNFQVQATSPVLNQGNPQSYSYAEPAPNGGRVDLGAFGNTAQTAVSAAQVVQVLSPSGLEKYQLGQQVTINWQSAGLTTLAPVALIDAGGSGSDNFGPDQFETAGYPYSQTFTNAVNTSGVTYPAPQAVYQSYSEANSGVGNNLAYHVSVPDGVYTVQLDFVEPYQYEAVGSRVFDIQLQGTTVQSKYDIRAAAGAPFTATAKTYTVTVSGGQGLNLNLVNDAYDPAVLAGLEIYAVNPLGVTSPTVNLDLSADGGQTWTSIATGLGMDHFGRGNYLWTIPTTLTPGSQYLVRVTSNDGQHAQGISTQDFLIANNGHAYYVNDGSTTGDVYTTAVGDDANSGKTPNAPMASLRALLAAYNFSPGDVIYVDNGNYTVLQNIALLPQDSGVTIIGPTQGAATFNRHNANSQAYVFQLEGADNATLNQLGITGGYDGIYASSTAGSTGFALENSTLFANYSCGIDLESGNTQTTISGNTVYGVPSGPSAQQQSIGIYIADSYVTISGNTVYHDGSIGIEATSALNDTISNNTVYANPTGIYSYSSYNSTLSNDILVIGNIVHDNTSAGINGYDSVITSNQVYNQVASNGYGIEDYNSVVEYNVVYTNTTGISDENGVSINNNRLYNNSSVAISLYNGTVPVFSNQIYSNAEGIETTYYYDGKIYDNLIYAKRHPDHQQHDLRAACQWCASQEQLARRDSFQQHHLCARCLRHRR